jgi:transaldolase
MKLFCDGADLRSMERYAEEDFIHGFTTNPTLMAKEGVRQYETFAKEALRLTVKPISFEVLADEPSEMVRQARIIGSWGENVFIKIPIQTTKGRHTTEIISTLSREGFRINVTAVFTEAQVSRAATALTGGINRGIISVFAGRIADTGVDPIRTIRYARDWAGRWSEVLWASPRAVWDYYAADYAGAQIITMTPELIEKMRASAGKDLTLFSLETVVMFHNDAKASGLSL